MVAGVAGLALIVAGAATAMAQTTPDEAVATAVQIEADPASLSPVTVDAPAAEPVEVGRGPIECADNGACGDDGTASTIAVEVTSPQPATTPDDAAAESEARVADAVERWSDKAADAWGAWSGKASEHRTDASDDDERGPRRGHRNGGGPTWGGGND